jgi:hypothetical protein
MILVLHLLEVVEAEALLYFGEILLTVVLSITQLIILAPKSKKLVAGRGFLQVSMVTQKLLEEDTLGILFVVLQDR